MHHKLFLSWQGVLTCHGLPRLRACYSSLMSIDSSFVLVHKDAFRASASASPPIFACSVQAQLPYYFCVTPSALSSPEDYPLFLPTPCSFLSYEVFTCTFESRLLCDTKLRATTTRTCGSLEFASVDMHGHNGHMLKQQHPNLTSCQVGC